jgi:hypothetical protein
MKHLKLIALFVGITLFFNCCDETDDFTIIGKWKPKLSVQKDYYDGVLTYSETYTPSTKNFYKDGTGLMSNDVGYSQTFTWSLEKNKLTLSYTLDYSIPINNTWEITNTTGDSFEMQLTVQHTSVDPVEGTETEYKSVNTEKYYK